MPKSIVKIFKQSFEDWCLENKKTEFLSIWDYELTKILPSEISSMSHYKVYLKCPLGKHKSELYDLTSFTNMKIEFKCKGCNSIGEDIISSYGEDFLNMVWSKNNPKSPFEYSKSSSQKVLWNHLLYDYELFYSIHEMNRRNFIHLYTIKNISSVKVSKLQKKVANYLNELGYLVTHEYECMLKPINPSTHYTLPIDNEIDELHLVIEVNGEQHYGITSWDYYNKDNSKLTPEEKFEYRLYKDYIKKKFVLDSGYNYLEIPYWSENRNLYKKLINDKIKEIRQNIKIA